MNSFEFGVIPCKTIFDEKALNNLHIKKYNEKLKIISNESKHIHKLEINIDNMENYYLKNLIKKKSEHEFLELNYKLELKIDNNDNHGKLEIWWNNNKINEIIDHNDKIIDIFYNPRLNMFATISLDGLACIYILPGKLISIIKHPNNLYFDKIFLSSNPFPTVITFDKKSKIISSYSLSGIIINQMNFEDKDKSIKIEPMFNIYGGGNRDRIKVELNEYFEIYNLPFFDFSPNGRRKSTVKK
jgi:hypothetical protein